MKNKENLTIRSIKVPGLYLIFGFLWILFSDQLIFLIAKDAQTLAKMQTFKGWFFILVTALLLYTMIRRTLKSLQKVEFTLRKSEERLSATLSSIGDGIISTDERGKIVSLNSVAEELTGWSSIEAAGLPIEDIFPIVNSQTRAPLKNPVEQCLREGRSVERATHTLLIHRNGTKYHIADSCSPIQDATGAIIGAVLAFRDVTEEYHQRRQLRDERERLSSVLWGTGVGTWEWNLGTGETCFNPRWAEMIGYSLAELSPVSIKTWEKFLHPEDSPRVDEALRQHAQGDTDYYECECRLRHKKGHWVWVLARGKITARTESGQPLRMAGTHLEITDRKLAQETLRLNEERLQSVIRVAPTGIGVVRNRVFSEVNQRICEMTGYAPEELIGKSSLILYPSTEDYDWVGKTKYEQIQATGTGVVETRWLRKDGGSIDIWLASAPLNPADLSQGVTFTALDITERRQAEKALRESERKLSRWMGNLPGIAYRCRNDRNWTMEFISEGCHALTGYSPEDLKHSYSDIIHPDDRESVWETVQTAVAEKRPYQIEFRIRTASGEERWVWEQGLGVFSSTNTVEALEGIIIDVTDRKRAEKALTESEARYRSLFENNHAVMLVVDSATGAVVDANPAAASWYGWSRDELCQKNIYDIDKLARMDQIYSQQNGPSLSKHRRADGSLRDVEVFSGPVQMTGRSLLYSIVHDITEKKRAEEALEKRILALTRPLGATTSITFEELFNLEDIQRLQDDFARATGVGAIVVCPDGRPITVPSNSRPLCQDIVRKTKKGYANCRRSHAGIEQPSEQGPSIRRCLGAGLWDAGAAILVDGRHIANWLVGQVRDTSQTEEQIRTYAREIEADENAMVEAFRKIPAMSGEQFRQVAQAMYTLANQLSVSAYQNVQQARFITEQKQAQEKIAFLAHHDQLTGLANRTLFADHFEQAAAHALRTGTKMALCVLDLDSFKAINDSHGHPQGDQLLCEVAKRLKDSVRSSDTVCRIGGDEFVILFTEIQKTDAIATLIQKTLDCFTPRFNLEGTLHSVSASMGVAVFPEDGVDFSTLFEHADATMYYAKESGRNNVQFFSQEINQRVQRRLMVENELRQALLDNQLELHYQPIIQLPAQRIAGMEALVRWRHPQKGLIPPDQFIPIAEESNLIVALGQWVLKAACREMASWRKQGLPSLPVSVNVSARQLFEKDFATFVKQTLLDCDLPAQQLDLEVTENIFLEGSDSVETVMNDLKDIGVGLVLDDFGTGYSSLNYLKRFHIQKLKIDRSFMEQVCHNQQDAILVKTIIGMAHNLSMQVVSEGVETAEQVEFLIDQGCELAQGFFFSKPLPLAAMQELLSQSETRDLQIQEHIMIDPV